MPYLSNDPSLKNYRRRLRRDQTDAENKLWRHLRNKRLDGFKFFRQYSYGHYILDFYCPRKRLAIELDGGQHLEAKEYDKQRTFYLNCKGIRVIRFWNNEVLQNTDVVVEVVWQHLTNRVSENNSPDNSP